MKKGLGKRIFSLISAGILLLGLIISIIPMGDQKKTYVAELEMSLQSNLINYSKKVPTEKEIMFINKLDLQNSKINQQNSNVTVSKVALQVSVVVDNKTNKKNYVSYHMVSGQDIDSSQSSLIITYDYQGKEISEQLVTVKKISSGQIITSKINGETVFNGQKNNDGVYVNAQVKQGGVTRSLSSAELRSLSSWVSCMNKQLSNMGLPSWIIGVVTVGCAAICVATAGTGCWACLGVAAVGYGAEIGYALGHC